MPRYTRRDSAGWAEYTLELNGRNYKVDAVSPEQARKKLQIHMFNNYRIQVGWYEPQIISVNPILLTERSDPRRSNSRKKKVYRQTLHPVFQCAYCGGSYFSEDGFLPYHKKGWLFKCYGVGQLGEFSHYESA